MDITWPENFEPPPPLKIYDSQDVTIIIFAPTIHPNKLTLKQLKNEDIIPSHWRIKKSQKITSISAQYSLIEGLNIRIFKGKIMFSKKIIHAQINLPQIAKLFINKYGTQSYHKVQIIFRRVITLPTNDNQTGETFIDDRFLSGKDWKFLGHKPSKRQINLFYDCVPAPLMINVINLPFKSNLKNYQYCLFFRGLIEYKLDKESPLNRVNYFTSIIGQYQDNLDNFSNIIDQKILSS